MRIFATLLFVAGLAFAQLDDDTITVVSRGPSAATPPGSVTINLRLDTALGTGLDEVLAALSPTGASERDLVAVGTMPGCPRLGQTCSSAMSWQFRFSAPLSMLKDTLAKLERAGVGGPGMDISYSVYSDAASAAPDCAYPTLISQARRYADTLAAAAGVRVGRVTALAEGPAVGLGGVGIPSAVLRLGDFSQAITGSFVFSDFLLGSPAPVFPTPCGVTVQFQLLR